VVVVHAVALLWTVSGKNAADFRRRKSSSQGYEEGGEHLNRSITNVVFAHLAPLLGSGVLVAVFVTQHNRAEIGVPIGLGLACGFGFLASLWTRIATRLTEDGISQPFRSTLAWASITSVASNMDKLVLRAGNRKVTLSLLLYRDPKAVLMFVREQLRRNGLGHLVNGPGTPPSSPLTAPPA
jgi:hypothetical protein